jgi:glycerophosphoryl diester phosphodiesterase|tara:strand:+ start:2412 stop:3056 length:645 start_codon:yes stop_codon:yes gene_type:complete
VGHLLIHRGLAKKTLVENTLKSFRYCFQRNFGIETDLHATKDNKIVCFHDFNLKKQFKINKRINKINYKDLRDISKKKNKLIPLLSDLIKLSNNRRFLMLEVKPLFQKDKIDILIKEVSKLKKFSITSFKEKNIINLYNKKKSLDLGLLIPSTFNFENILLKSRKKYVKFLVLEKKFLTEKRLIKIKKRIYFYTIKKSTDFKKYKKFNLIFENL